MTAEGDAARARLGPETAALAERLGREAPPPGPELATRLAVLMRRFPARATAPDAAA